VQHHLQVVAAMIDRAATLTDDQLDRPITLSVAGIDDRPTVRRLLSRLVGQLDMWNTVVAMGAYDFAIERHETIAELRTRLERVGPAFLDQVVEVERGGRLQEIFVDVHSRPVRTFTYGGMIAHVLTYAAHRRTLVAGALETAGITDLIDDPLAWIDDDR
jgi:AraC family transcriptional regulator